jgi:hypothetical protein
VASFAPLVLFLLAAEPGAGPAVAQGGALLRTACAKDAGTVATLPAGTPVALRFSMSGDLGQCYKVTAGAQSGYLLAGEITGLESYERARRAAPDTGLPREIRADPVRLGKELRTQAAAPAAGSTDVTPTVAQALRLLDQRLPKQALRLVEWSLAQENRKDPFVLAVAGLAAYQSDNPRRAVEYWAESLAVRPNASVEALYHKAIQEVRADNSAYVVHGGRFVLRYDQGEVPAAVADTMLAALDEEYTRVDAALGCAYDEQITAIVMTRDAYRAVTGAAEWSGGQYDGRIRVVVPERGVLTPDTRRAFAHEIVHACLAHRGSFPVWFHEGLAQKWSGERLSAAGLAAVRERLRSRAMPFLNNMSPAWSQMSAEHARLAYAYALAAVEAIYQSYGDAYVRDLIRSPSPLAAVADTISRALAQ